MAEWQPLTDDTPCKVCWHPFRAHEGHFCHYCFGVAAKRYTAEHVFESAHEAKQETVAAEWAGYPLTWGDEG